ncbi:MAG: DUF4011 domain-containing protein [Clostridia bacterium]|nr:DUF4011 domain-containing protein [Clostridia bacterium]
MTANLMNRKLELWRHRLLDLGKRNRMINYRETKRSTIRITEPSYNELFRRIAISEDTLTFRRTVDRDSDLRVYSMLSLMDTLSAPLDVRIGDIETNLAAAECQKTLRNMRTSARLAQEEQGTNILYLAFGFLEWKETPGANEPWLRSPLVMVPAVLSLPTLHSPFTLSKHEDDIVVNPTLEYYLQSQMGITLPTFDEDRESLDDYFTRVEEIADQNGWRVVREVSLALLSFLKITMYNDLTRNEERIRQNPVIRAMCGDGAAANTLPEAAENFSPDSVSTTDCYQVMSADSSQQDAIYYSKHNISFVMQGPPGTGKSQTITNIIAEALADGKKVLFVSEKMAALQVVYRRLQEAHLGDFCLPLHSYRANKKEILEQIGANLQLKPITVRDSAMNQLGELLTCRNQLNEYASELHRPVEPLNLSCYEVFGRLEALKDLPMIQFALADVAEISQNQFQVYRDLLQTYRLSVERMSGDIRDNPWEGFICRRITADYLGTLNNSLADTVVFLTFCRESADQLPECEALFAHLTPELLPEFSAALTRIIPLPALPAHWTEAENEFDLPAARDAANRGNELYTNLLSTRSAIAKVFEDSVYDFNREEWQKVTSAAAERLQAASFASPNETAHYFAHSKPLIDGCIALNRQLDSLCNINQSINKLLGTNLSAAEINRNTYSRLLPLMQAGILPQKNWFTEEISEITAWLDAARRTAADLQSRRADLLSRWEPAVLTFDYAPILQRYKTDYTGFFRNFNRQYHADQRQIKGFSRTVLKKLPDTMAVELLRQLQAYHECVDWFANNNAQLASYLGSHYTGETTDWDTILANLQHTEEIKRVFRGKVPTALQDLLCADHTEQAARLAVLLEEYDSAASKANTIIGQHRLQVSLKKNAAETMKTVQSALDDLRILSRQFTVIAAHLQNSDTAYPEIASTLRLPDEYARLTEEINRETENFRSAFDFLYRGEETDWNELLRLLGEVEALRQSPCYPLLLPLMRATPERRSELSAMAEALSRRIPAGIETCGRVADQFDGNAALRSASLAALLPKLSGCLEQIDDLENWVDYQEAKSACAEGGLADFIEKAEDAEILSQIQDCFIAGVYRMWLEGVFENTDALRRFRRSAQDQRIARFIELDDLQLLIAQMRIRQKLIADLPSVHRLVKATDEVAILNKELGKKRNILPLRRLFRQIPNLLLRLKPCLMMSPLSVSYFLETEAYHFDLVIFDEASQIFPEDAIGAIFRGAQVIVAGDSKQLPPTNFFATATNNSDDQYDPDENDESEDSANAIVSDSILEETASVLPNRTLLWHYRSRHESLIAFSNREIYRNNLITFPDQALNVPDMGVEYVYVEDGVYEGGGKNRNLREAERCVELVEAHIKQHPKRSLGIIAFSQKQQTAIEEAIIAFRRGSPQYEWFFDENKEEPFFVKNLENVQGDERDTIIFSICYAKDRSGKMYMRFGPLGQDGGERRLNVAITRAKCNIKLVGSIHASDIDLSRTEAEGVRMLRSYIEFAGRGTSALRPVDDHAMPEGGDLFCDAMEAFLTDHGYRVKKHVGCSDYKIDLAIVDPGDENRFIAGIECDGQSYIQGKTARDRDHLRRGVMEGRGWKLYRIWSTEWNRNPEEEGEALLTFLRSLTENTPAPASDPDAPAEPGLDSIVREISPEGGKISVANPFNFAYYAEADWTAAKHSRSKDQLTRLSETILHVLNVEQPMHMDLLYRRIAPSLPEGKVTETARSRIDLAISRKLGTKIAIDGDRFIRLIPETPVTVRIPRQGDTPRPMEYIPTEEVAAAMVRIATHSIGINRDDLTLECARAFGFERKGPRIKAKTDAALQYLEEHGTIRIIDEKVQLIGDAE